ALAFPELFPLFPAVLSLPPPQAARTSDNEIIISKNNSNFLLTILPPYHFYSYYSFPYKWQATNLSGLTSSNAGEIVLHLSITNGHLVWKTQPDGGVAGFGTSPFKTIRSFWTSGSGLGIAET